MTRLIPAKIFYGWRIVGAAYVTLFISVGFLFYSYGVFFPALEAEFGGGRFAVSIGLALMNLAIGLSSPNIGRLIDTWSIRGVMMLGAASMSVGFVVASQITAIWQFYLLLATLLGVGASMIGQLPSSTLVANWFVKRRGLALGVATMGVSTSGMVMAPVTTQLIERFGWRTTFIIFGAITAGAILPLVRAIVVDRPESMNLHPDGKPGRALELDEEEVAALRRSPALPTPPEFTMRATFRNPNFWAIALTIASCFFMLGAVLVHMVPHVRDLGFAPMNAAYVLAMSAGVGVIGKIVFGFVADYVDTRLALFTCILFQAAGVALLLYAQAYPALLVAGAVFGFGMGGVVPLWGSLIGEYFSQRTFGRVMGLMTPCMLPLQISGVPYAGYIFDRFGAYDIAFKTFLGIAGFASLTLIFVRHRTPVDAPSPNKQSDESKPNPPRIRAASKEERLCVHSPCSPYSPSPPSAAACSNASSPSKTPTTSPRP